MRPIALALPVLLLAACGAGAPPEADPLPPPAAGDERPGPEHETSPSDAAKAGLDHRAFAESDADIVNPERGFFDWVELGEADDYAAVRDRGFSLAYTEITLSGFLDAPIGGAMLSKIKAAFDLAREAGIKLVLRANYSTSSGDPITDAPQPIILGHIAQLAPLLTAHADVIAAVQAGFIGRWGEWHSSTNGLDDDPAARAAVLDALLGAVPPSRMIQVRTPEFKAAFTGDASPLNASDAFSVSAAARIGHHNDCFLASATDMGTYPSGEIELWKAFLEEDARFVSMGGESCAVNPPRSGCDEALAEMGRLHWSYLNSEYHEGVIGGWEAQGCLGEIERRLGYRFVATDLWWNREVAAGGALTVILRIRNDGFAAPFNERPVLFVLTDGIAAFSSRADADPRRWEGAEEAEVAAQIAIPVDASSGAYRLLLCLPDGQASLEGDPRYAVRLANEGLWDAPSGCNALAEVVVAGGG